MGQMIDTLWAQAENVRPNFSMGAFPCAIGFAINHPWRDRLPVAGRLVNGQGYERLSLETTETISQGKSLYFCASSCCCDLA